MKTFMLPPDDLASTTTSVDRVLLLELQETVRKQFYQGCDRISQTLLIQCQWSLTLNADVPTLALLCPNSETYWHIIDNIENFGNYLRRVIPTSRIEVIPGDKKNIYLEIEIGT